MCKYKIILHARMISMVTLHIHVPSHTRQQSKWADQEDRFVRSQALCTHICGGDAPSGLMGDSFSGELSFCMITPKGYRSKSEDPFLLYTFRGNHCSDLSPDTAIWALSLMESWDVPVCILPLPELSGDSEGQPKLYHHVELMEEMLSEMAARHRLVMVSHGTSCYEPLMLMVRETARTKKLFCSPPQLTALFGGDLMKSDCVKISDRADLHRQLLRLGDRVSLIALTSDRRVSTSDIIRSWMDQSGSVTSRIDLIKPGVASSQGLFPDDEPLQSTDAANVSVLQQTRSEHLLRLEVSHMMCGLLRSHTSLQ